MKNGEVLAELEIFQTAEDKFFGQDLVGIFQLPSGMT